MYEQVCLLRLFYYVFDYGIPISFYSSFRTSLVSLADVMENDLKTKKDKKVQVNDKRKWDRDQSSYSNNSILEYLIASFILEVLIYLKYCILVSRDNWAGIHYYYYREVVVLVKS